MSVAENVKEVAERMSWAAARAGRRLEDVQLVAVTKTVDIGRVREAAEAGVRIFGENYVQEAREKIEAIGHGIEWHMTGHLQRNKAKEAVAMFDMIQTIDSVDLAMELDKRARAAGKTIRGLIEVNLGGEGSKAGISKGDLIPLLTATSELSNLSIQGLMTIPPYYDHPEQVRPYFRTLRELKDEVNEKGFPLAELSMGMSHDFEVAIEEGATMVRVGTAIFGERRR